MDRVRTLLVVATVLPLACTRENPAFLESNGVASAEETQGDTQGSGLEDGSGTEASTSESESSTGDATSSEEDTESTESTEGEEATDTESSSDEGVEPVCELVSLRAEADTFFQNGPEESFLCQTGWMQWGQTGIDCDELNFGLTAWHGVWTGGEGTAANTASYMAIRLQPPPEMQAPFEVAEASFHVQFEHLEPAPPNATISLRAFVAGEEGYWTEGQGNASTDSQGSTFKYRYPGVTWPGLDPINATGEVLGSVDVAGRVSYSEAMIALDATLVASWIENPELMANGFLVQGENLWMHDSIATAIEGSDNGLGTFEAHLDLEICVFQ